MTSRLNFNYVVFLHRLYDGDTPKLGGIDYFLDYVNNQGCKTLLVETPLIQGQNRYINISIKSSEQGTLLEKIKIPFPNSKFTWLFGIFVDFYAFFKYSPKNPLIISIDPLSSVPAMVLKKLKYAKFHYYHCTDYSDVRFSNFILNAVYRYLLKISIGNADLIGCVSKRIETAVNNYKYRKLFYFPNSPSFYEYDKYRVDVKNRASRTLVITCAFVSKRYKILEIIELMHKLVKKLPDLKLRVIGNTQTDIDYYNDVKKKIKTLDLERKIEFVGFVPRDENCRLIGECAVGLAFFNRNDTYSWYSDPLKIREYAALGIPCLADNVTSAAEEMQANNAGIMIQSVENLDEAEKEIIKLLTDTEYYSKLANGALDWAQKFDKQRLNKELIAKFDEYAQ